MKFEFSTAPQIIFGNNSIEKIGQLSLTLGKTCFLVCGRNTLRAEIIQKTLNENKISSIVFQITQEPTVSMIEDGIKKIQSNRCDFVIGIGGGSVIDAAKAIAALSTNSGTIYNYLEVIGLAKPLLNPPLPCIAIPTTSGTGTEVTKNATLICPDHKVKISLRGPQLIPQIAVIDPELTHTMPPFLTACTGLDALTQIIESFVSHCANPVTDALCRDGLNRVRNSLIKAYTDGHNNQARQDMALASLIGGIALSNAKLGAVHGFAGPIGGMFAVAHGVVCAGLLPNVIEHNIRLLQKNALNHVLIRYHEIAQILTRNEDAAPEDAIVWIKEVIETCKIPHLSYYGITKSHFSEIIFKAKNSSSMKGNPILLDDDDLLSILHQAT